MSFQPYSSSRLEAVLQRHPVTSQGRAYIDQALREPDRNAAGSTRNVVTDLPCPKMRMNMQSAGKKVHAPLLRAHVFSPSTVGYVTFPPSLELCYIGSRERVVRTRHTADCLVFDSMVGCHLEIWHTRRPSPTSSTSAGDDSQDHAREALADACKRFGFGLRSRYAEEVSSISDLNRKYLFSYLHPEAARCHEHQVPALFSRFRDASCRYASDLVDDGVDQDLLNFAVAHGHLHIDFDDAELSQHPDQVLVFRYAESLAAWQRTASSIAARPKPPGPGRNLDLRPRDSIMLDGKPLSVCMAGSTAVHAVDATGVYVELSLTLLYSAYRAGKLTLPERLSEAPPPGPLWNASPRRIAQAAESLEILQKMERQETLAPEEMRASATIRRWRRALREGETQGLTPVEALLVTSDGRGFRGPHIDAQLSADIDAFIRERQQDKLCASTRTEYERIGTWIQASGRRMVSMSSFYERWNRCRSPQSIEIQQGHKAAYQVSPVYWMLDRETPVHARRAMELVHIDSTLLDIRLLSSLSGDVAGRPWLTLATCAHSRRVLGMHLSFRPPSYMSSMSVLADIIRRFGRIPDAIIHDWGSEFRARDFRYGCTSLFIERHIRPKSAPRFGAVLERMFGVVTRELLDNIAGNTKATKQVRLLTLNIDPSTHCGLTLLDLHDGLEEYFFSVYDSRKHPATLRTPRAGFETSFMSGGLRAHRLKRLEDVMQVVCPTARSRPAVVDPARGIYVNHQYYGHPLLTSRCVVEPNVLVKVVPFDPSIVLAFVAGGWQVCKSSLHTELLPLSNSARRCMYEELFVERQLLLASHQDARRLLLQLMDRLNEAALSNKEYYQDRELHPLLPVADCELAEGPNVDKVADFDRMMREVAREVVAGRRPIEPLGGTV